MSQWSNTSAHLGGNQPSYTVVRYPPIAAGRFIDEQDVLQARRVVPYRAARGRTGRESCTHRGRKRVRKSFELAASRGRDCDSAVVPHNFGNYYGPSQWPSIGLQGSKSLGKKDD